MEEAYKSQISHLDDMKVQDSLALNILIIPYILRFYTHSQLDPYSLGIKLKGTQFLMKGCSI
jgi:hypothetical protein